MAPVYVACRLFLLQSVLFLLFLITGAEQTESLLVYDRQFLLSLRSEVRDLGTLDRDDQNTLPPLLARIPSHLLRLPALPSRRRRLRRRGKRGGLLVRLKLQLSCSSFISRASFGLLPPLTVPWRFLDPTGIGLVPVTGFAEGLKPRRPCPSRLSRRGVNHSLSRSLPLAPGSDEPPVPVLTARIGLVNARSLVNKTFLQLSCSGLPLCDGDLGRLR